MGLFDVFRPPLEARAGAGEPPGASAAVMPPKREALVATDPMSTLTLSAVYRAVSIIQTTAAQMPIAAKRGEVHLDVPLLKRPDQERSQGSFVQQTVFDLALFGNAYWWVTRNAAGNPVNLRVLHPASVSVALYDDSRSPFQKVKYSVNGRDVKRTSIVHLKLTDVPGQALGIGPIQAAREDLHSALRVRAYGNQVFDSGVPSGVLSTDQFLNQEQADAYRDTWETVMAGDRRVAVLGNGMHYDTVMMDPEDAQWLQAQEFSVTNIARLFGIPTLFMAAGVEGTSMTYVNSEQMNRVFLVTTLMQYINPIEDALSELLPRGTEARFKVDALLRSDIQTRTNSYKTLVEIGAMTPTEVRLSEGMDSTPLGDFIAGDGGAESDSLTGAEE